MTGRDGERRTQLWIALGIGALTAVAYALLGWRQWEQLIAPSWDLGIFSQLAKAYSQFEAPIVPIKGHGFNLLGDHFHPILILLGPIWALWPSGLALLVTQAVLFGVSAVPLARLAMERLGTAMGAALGIAYALGWGLQSAAEAQFHEIAFAVPILAFGLTAYLRGRFTAAALWIGLLVFVKEDLGLTVAVFGAILALRKDQPDPDRRWRIGWMLVAWGLVWLLLATFVILPALNPGGEYDYTGRLGSLWEIFVPIDKYVTVLMLVATAGVVGVRSPLILLMLPTLAWRFAGAVPFYWGWGWHYSAILMPIAAAALLDAMPGRRKNRWLAVGATVAVTLVLGARLPLAWLLVPDTWETSWRTPYAREAIDAVGQDASVETDITLMAPLVSRADVYWLGNGNPAPEYVLLDQMGYVWKEGEAPTDAAVWAEDRYPGTTYTTVYSEGGFHVAVREGGTDPGFDSAR
nr:DUF2079 domain-containing protein [Actinomycetales bacterium]